MTDESELYCKISVDTNRDSASLLNVIGAALGGGISGRTVSGKSLEVDVSQNEDFDPVLRESPRGFVFFKYYLDVVRKPSADRSEYVSDIRALLAFLKQDNCRVMPACDFEEELT